MSVTEPRSGLGLVHSWGLGTNNWHTEMDANLKKLGLFGVHCCVLDKDLTTPPGSPSNGDAYIVAATATGAWTGHEKHIAIWDTSLTTPAWTFGTPREGWLCYVTDEAVLYVYHSAAWVTGGTEANTLANGKTGATTAAGARTNLHVGQQAINAQTGTTYTPVTADANNIVTLSNASAITVTLPTPTSISVNAGETVTFVKEGAGDVTFVAGSGATVNSPESCLRQITQFSMVFATAKSTTLWNLSGALVA